MAALAVKAMLSLLRLVSLLLGCAITVAPSFLALAFAYGAWEPPETTVAFTFNLLPLFVGLIFGMGPLLIGIPKLVAGPEKPKVRVAAGTFVVISVAGLLIIGFDGSVTRDLTPIALLVEAALFAVFIWPAKHFPANPAVNTDAAR
ncbi:hypothetical protein [Methylophaga sp.]|uniref:hypothetical protein n=1 Tax=Methylophaga sp. TaxID=2024840 RepID=UPI0025F6060F|nr:hypothetical protein [Methylophaga sp.]